ncbi:MAG TPA: diguanylate cyclase, partial [Vicinamibacteria bacterium]|nr:diguanylate cyclase [Vicinamibacteria bacterium]
LMGAYLLQRSEDLLAEKVRETLSNHLFRASAQLDDWMQQRVHEVSRWSASFVVFEGVEDLSRPGGAAADKARRDLETYLESVLGHYRNYESLFVIDLEGNVLASTRPERWEDWGRALLDHGPERGGVVSPIHRSAFLGRPTLLVVHTVQGRENRTLGYFVERVDLRELESLLRPTEGDPAFSFWLLDEEGRVLVRAGKVPDDPGGQVFPGALPEPGTETGQIQTVTLPGAGSSIYGVRRMRGPRQGFVVGTVAESAAYRPLVEAGNRLLRIVLPLVGAVLLASLLVARSLLKPIHRLSAAAKHISAGELDVSLPVQGNDELADLTLAFNEMALRVRESQQTLESLAITDGLTGLYNRRHFEDTFDKELRRCEREGRTSSLLLLDVDHFKKYNDRWGHTQGDGELKRVAAAVKEAIRATDSAFRYGGEELAVLLHSCPKEQAALVAEKIGQAVRAPGLKPGALEGRTTTISIGVSTFPEDGQGVRALVDAADAALYEAKAHGRDRVALAGPSTGARGAESEPQEPLRKDPRDKPRAARPS